MTVSAVIVTFNRRSYIRRAIDSVMAQTVPVDEIIVVDDERSTDGIREAIDGLYGPRVRVVTQGGGLSGARRRGVQEACGEWIAFLDSDDEWMPDRNRELSTAAERVPPEVAWIFGDMRIVSDEGDAETLYGRYGLSIKESPQVFADALSVQYPFQFGLLQGSFIRRSVLLEIDCFNEGLQSSEDFLVGFQVACRYKFAAISSVVGKYFQTSDLFATSATVEGTFGPDYHRARMLAFALVAESGRRRPWNTFYAAHVRGLCQALARREAISRKMAMQQFRYGGLSLKGMAFLAAAVFGRGGIRAWNAIAEIRRKHMRTVGAECAIKTGFEAAIDRKSPAL
jgi:glycosyltransferase involved in cell wall biosynthesis